MTGIIGYIASAMVLLTFITKDMRQLRFVGILSNVSFIGYGALAWLPPILFLHLLLLPLNIVRLMELQKTASGPALDSAAVATF
jgi:hypothetical protein